MTDMISCEEVFENDPQALAEFEAVCDEWQDDAVKEQDFASEVDEDCGWFGYAGLCED